MNSEGQSSLSELKKQLEDIQLTFDWINDKLRNRSSQIYNEINNLLTEKRSNLLKAKTDLNGLARIEDLDKLEFLPSNYPEGGFWLPADKVPAWALNFDYPLSTYRFKYYLTGSKNLKRWDIPAIVGRSPS